MRRARIVLSAMLALLLVAGCGLTPRDQASGSAAKPAAVKGIDARKIKAVTTIGMISDVVAVVGGDRVEVVALMGPGVDPHLYKPSQSDTAKLNEADVIFYNGLSLEGKMGDLFVKMARNKPTVPVAATIPEDKLLEPDDMQGHYDPHVWFDVTLWKLAVDPIEQTLSEMDPGSRALYKANADRYRKQLDELHAWTTEQINQIPQPQRVLVTAHDAFGYFGRQYGVEVVGLQGISTETEAGVRDVQTLADLIASRDVKAIFVESSVPRRNIEAVQAAVQAKGKAVRIGGELFSDAMGEPGTPAGTYVGMIRHNVTTIVEALK